MTDLQDQISQVELTIEYAEEKVALRNSLVSLANDPKFKSIVDQGYFVDTAARLVLLKAEPGQQSKEDQLDIIKRIDAVGYFRQYLSSIIMEGNAAERALKADRETLEELRAEV